MSDEIVVLPSIKRKSTSIWIDPLIWKGFKNKCSVTGQSTCHVLEAFMYAFDRALPNQPISALPAVNVNLTVNRVVQRVHRVERDRGKSSVGKLISAGEYFRTKKEREARRAHYLATKEV